MSAPDRIWARPVGATLDWYGSTSGPWSLEDPYGTATQFIASTPAREHAEELGELLGEMWEFFRGDAAGDDFDAHEVLDTAKALLSKIDTGDGNE